MTIWAGYGMTDNAALQDELTGLVSTNPGAGTYRRALERIVSELEGMHSEDWTKAEQNIHRIATSVLK